MHPLQDGVQAGSTERLSRAVQELSIHLCLQGGSLFAASTEMLELLHCFC